MVGTRSFSKRSTMASKPGAFAAASLSSAKPPRWKPALKAGPDAAMTSTRRSRLASTVSK